MILPEGYAVLPVGPLWRATWIPGTWYGPIRRTYAEAAADAQAHDLGRYPGRNYAALRAKSERY